MNNCYILLVFFISFVLTLYEMKYGCHTNKSHQACAFLLINIHHFLKLIWFLTPLLFRLNKPTLYLFLIGFIYMYVQNVHINVRHDNPYRNTCILSNITNKMCKLDDTEVLKSIPYHLGITKDLLFYSNCIFNNMLLVYIFIIFYKIKHYSTSTKGFLQ